jgi:hypothetical protein
MTHEKSAMKSHSFFILKINHMSYLTLHSPLTSTEYLPRGPLGAQTRQFLLGQILVRLLGPLQRQRLRYRWGHPNPEKNMIGIWQNHRVASAKLNE